MHEELNIRERRVVECFVSEPRGRKFKEMCMDKEEVERMIAEAIGGLSLAVSVSKEYDYYSKYLQVEVTLYDREGNRISTYASSTSID